MIDIHVHTNHSDGDYSVKKLLEEAQNIGLSLLSITDHDTVSAYDELKYDGIRKEFSGKIISGVELTTVYNGEIIEILGYGFDIDKMNEFICNNYMKYDDKQRKQFELIKHEYNKRGFVFSEDNVYFAPENRLWKARFTNELKKYPDNYKYLINNKSFDSHTSFFRNEVYNPKSPFYVSQSLFYPSLGEVLNAVHSCGGKAFLAHVYIYSENIINSIDDILDNYDIDGLECFYSSFSKEQTEYLIYICKSKELLISGGSDCHGTRRLNHSLGVGDGTLNISYDIVKNWVNDKFI